jgi:YggT family protein
LDMHIICILLYLYLIVLIASVAISWIAMVRPLPYSGPGRRVIDIIYMLTNPVFRLVRGVLPPLQLGRMGLDLSPMIVFIVLAVILNVVCR